LNKYQLDAIRNVSLKPVEPNQKQLKYETRHPVLKELLKRAEQRTKDKKGIESIPEID
jgi:hypothetical protein